MSRSASAGFLFLSSFCWLHRASQQSFLVLLGWVRKRCRVCVCEWLASLFSRCVFPAFLFVFRGLHWHSWLISSNLTAYTELTFDIVRLSVFSRERKRGCTISLAKVSGFVIHTNPDLYDESLDFISLAPGFSIPDPHPLFSHTKHMSLVLSVKKDSEADRLNFP